MKGCELSPAQYLPHYCRDLGIILIFRFFFQIMVPSDLSTDKLSQPLPSRILVLFIIVTGLKN